SAISRAFDSQRAGFASGAATVVVAAALSQALAQSAFTSVVVAAALSQLFSQAFSAVASVVAALSQDFVSGATEARTACAADFSQPAALMSATTSPAFFSQPRAGMP